MSDNLKIPLTRKKASGFYQLKLEIEQMKKIINELKDAINKLELNHKYIVNINKRLKGELIQLSFEMASLKNDKRKER